MIFLFHVTRYSNITFLLSKYICRPDVSELETKLAEQSKILLNLQQKVDDLASKVYPNLDSFYLFIYFSFLFKRALCVSLVRSIYIIMSTIHTVCTFGKRVSAKCSLDL
jgi:hypothetical protein